MATERIRLFSKQHAIEAEQFTIVFRGPLDGADEGRFQEAREHLETLFGAIDEPNFFQVVIGNEQPTPPVMKVMNDFGRNGKPTWTGQFGENAVSLTCMQYSNWNEIWPKVAQRFNALLLCVDPFKHISSIDYRVTDTLIEDIPKEGEPSLLSKNIFKGDSWTPANIMKYSDPRWDFSAGEFISSDGNHETLERVEARSVISGNEIVASVSNMFSHRYKGSVRLKDIFTQDVMNSPIAQIFSDFHDKNKVTIRSILVDDLLSRMGVSDA